MSVRLSSSRLLILLLPALVASAPPPPATIAPYIHDGRLEPGDYSWLRGSFEGAGAAEVAAYRALMDWRRRCRMSDMAETRGEMARLGVVAGASLDTIPYRTLVCSQVAVLPEGLDLRDWDGFVRDVSVVRPFVDGFLAAVADGEGSSMAGDPDLRDALTARTTGEQTLRAGLLSASGSSDERTPMTRFTVRQRSIVASRLAVAMKERDHANTDWLKGVVAAGGWPRRSQVGERAARAAWLLVQHADADPAFQVRALRLIEPLVASGEADRRKFAYLYDRVMLKVTGRQRYATQLTCREGRFVPFPTESEDLVDARRREMGMGPLAEHGAQAMRGIGPCRETPDAR